MIQKPRRNLLRKPYRFFGKNGCYPREFSRSKEIYKVKYGNYIGDGDSKTFKAILDLNPYSDFKVMKNECVGYVEKRMGTRLRNLKKKRKTWRKKQIDK